VLAAAVTVAGSGVGAQLAASEPGHAIHLPGKTDACARLAAHMAPMAEREFSAPAVGVIAGSPLRAALLRATATDDAEPDQPLGQHLGVTQVKGGRVYTFQADKASDGVLRIADTTGGRLRLLGEVRLTGQIARAVLVLPGDRVLLVGEGATSGTERAYSGGGLLYRPWTDLTLVDVRDPARPGVVRSDRVDGVLLEAYERDGVVRAVFSSRPRLEATRVEGESDEAARARNVAAARAASGEDWLPMRVTRDAEGVVVERPLLACSDVTIPPGPAGLGISSVVTIDARTDTLGGTARGVAGLSRAAYISDRRIYVATEENAEDPANRRAVGTTGIHAFDATRRDASPHVAYGIAPGLASGSYGFSERDGLLRVVLGPDALTGTSPGERAHRRGLAVLAEGEGRLELVGAIPRIGDGDEVTSVTWLGDIAVIRQSYNSKVIHVVDVSDPVRPRVAATTRLPRWVKWLHPVGPRLAVASNEEPTGRDGSVRYGLIDFADPAAPREVQRGGFGENDQRGVITWLPQRRLLVLGGMKQDVMCTPPGSTHCGSRASIVVHLVRVGRDGRLREVRRLPATSGLGVFTELGDDLLLVGGRSLTLLDGRSLRVRDELALPTSPGGRGK
jgi:hypothetical protein